MALRLRLEKPAWPMSGFGFAARGHAHYLVRMGVLFDEKAPRRAVNLSLNSDLLSKARACGLNLSGIAEEAIKREVARIARERFEAEIRRSVEQYEAYLAEYGSLWEALADMADDDAG